MAISFPENPELNQIYGAGSKTWKWNGTSWRILNPPVSKFSASENEPQNPLEGNMWFNTLNENLYIYTNNLWIQIGKASSLLSVMEVF